MGHIDLLRRWNNERLAGRGKWARQVGAASGCGIKTEECSRRMNDKDDILTRGEIDRIMMMAWEDRTSFESIRTQFGLSPGDVIKLMRAEMTAKSFKMWRKRTQGRVTKHDGKFALQNAGNQVRRFRAKSQRG